MTDQKRQIQKQDFSVKCYYIFLCYLVGGELITKLLLQVTHSILHIPGKIDTMVLYAAIVLIAVAGFYGKIIRGKFRFKIPEIVLLCALLSVFFIGYFRTTGYTSLFSAMLKDFAFGILAYVFFRYCDDKERLLNDFALLSVLMTISMLLLLWLSGQNGILNSSYSQYYGYMIFPACIISTNETIRKKSVFYGLVATVGLGLSILMGARGPILLELVFVVIRLIEEPIHRVGKIVSIAVIAGIGTLIYFNLNSIVELLNRLAVSLNLSSRIFAQLSKGNLFASGRDNVYGAVLQIIDKHPLTGVGIGTDRIEVAKLLNRTDVLGTYSHNFFLDMLVQFGIIAGVVLIIGFVILTVRYYHFSKKSKAGISVFWVMITICFGPLLFSSSYFTYPLFFAMLAMQQSTFET